MTAGFAGAATAGFVVAALFAFFTLRIGSDQIITGTAVSLLCLGLTATLYRQLYGETGAALSIPTMHTVRVPVLVSIPVFGHALFDQPAVTYVTLRACPGDLVVDVSHTRGTWFTRSG